jgi:hypothetical protein
MAADPNKQTTVAVSYLLSRYSFQMKHVVLGCFDIAFTYHLLVAVKQVDTQ